MCEPAIIGAGAITSAGQTLSQTWEHLAAGDPAIDIVAAPDWPCDLLEPVGQIRLPLNVPEQHLDRAVQLGLIAARQALQQGPPPGDIASRVPCDRRAVVFGSSKGGLLTATALHKAWRSNHTQAPAELARFWQDVPPGAIAAHIARCLGFGGAHIGIVAACATGLHAVIRGGQMIRDGQAELVLAGAADASIHPLVLACFRKMKVTARCAPDPAGSCRPFDRARSGFVVGEGAGALLLAPLALAQERGWPIRAVLSGYALGHDPTGLIRLDCSGKTLASLIWRALDHAGIGPSHVGHISAHGTGTLANDLLESRAYRAVFDDQQSGPSVSGVKGGVGHLLGAAGAVEAALLVHSLSQRLALPTTNLHCPDPGCEIDLIKEEPRALRGRHAMAVSMGFGGHLAAAVFARA